MCISINLRCSEYVSWVPYWQIMLYLVNPHLEESYTSFRSLLAGYQEPYKSQLGPKKSSLASRMTVWNLLSLTHLNSRMCIRIYIFCLKKHTNKKQKFERRKENISGKSNRNWFFANLLCVLLTYVIESLISPALSRV